MKQSVDSERERDILTRLVANRSKPLGSVEITDSDFAEQHAFVLDPARQLAALCTRRAGKTNGLSLRFLRTLGRYPGAFSPYIALTRESAKNIMWGILQEHDERFKIGAKFTESNLTMTLPNDAKLQLFGADMKNFIKRLKGIKTPAAAVDEAQDFGGHIKDLVEGVLEPTITDYPDGWIALTGTPGPVPFGFFYDITEKKKYGYSLHKWSLFQNPYLPNAREYVAELKAKKGWTDDNPTLRREWYGEWVDDLDARVFKYVAALNNFSNIPALTDEWEYVIGVDLGYDDCDAIAVIGWHPKIKDAYLVEEFVMAHQDITDLVNQVESRINHYNPLKVVMDTGGLGKKIAEEIRKRRGIPVVAAEKTRKFEFIELLNDALRTRRFYAKQEGPFALDAARVKWDQDASDLKIDDSFHSDICDATLYAYREALHWLYEEEEKKPERNSKAYYDRIAQEMEEKALEELQREKENEQELEFLG